MRLHSLRLYSQIPGLISLSSKFLPTVMNLLKGLAEAGQVPETSGPQRNPAVTAKSIQNGASSSSSEVTSSENGTEYSSASKQD